MPQRARRGHRARAPWRRRGGHPASPDPTLRRGARRREAPAPPVKAIDSPSTAARTVSPSANRPSSSSSASGFSTSRWIARFSGRAPKAGSQPASAISATASSDSSSSILRSASRLRRRCSCSSTMEPIWSRVSGSKTTISSTRLTNSGRKCSSSCACARMFEVMITTVLRKSTVRPWPSVRRPSSSSCSSTLKTSLWAFSISSSRITQYGRRRTASVSWPPSSYPT